MQAAELQYYEALATMYERMGRYNAAARFALAAACQASALGGPGAGEPEITAKRHTPLLALQCAA